MSDKTDIPPLPVIFEDESLRVLNKPSGISVLKDNTGAPSVWDLYPQVFGEDPLSVHRLDKGCSGLLVVARTQKARSHLSRSQAKGLFRKTYLALARGEPQEPEGVIDLPLEKGRKAAYRVAELGSGLPSQTEYRVIAHKSGMSLLELGLLTGRTHQIRVHLAAVGCPLVEDPLYGEERRSPSEHPHLTLHAWKLSFPHPATGETVSLEAPPPGWAAGYLADSLS